MKVHAWENSQSCRDAAKLQLRHHNMHYNCTSLTTGNCCSSFLSTADGTATPACTKYSPLHFSAVWTHATALQGCHSAVHFQGLACVRRINKYSLHLILNYAVLFTGGSSTARGIFMYYEYILKVELDVCWKYYFSNQHVQAKENYVKVLRWK